ncbi:MAG: NAD(P)-dependent alcohol dehydrogenase [Anaerolineaceae bacterium]|nr:NAD(P)-dependent alcohol dehydrogenase [Anaerolineaceae bacterium]
MKAVILKKYGSPDGFAVADVEKPALKDNGVLIKVHAATVSAGDTEVRKLSFPIYLMLPIRIYLGILRPRKLILGQEIAGVIKAVGKDVTTFNVGDAVFGTTGMGFGGYAEYKSLPVQSEDGVLARKPADLSFEEAAALCIGGLESSYYLKKANIQPGERVLIVGAGGSIGSLGVQLAKHMGAEVTAVDSTGKLGMLRELGADHVIDFTKEAYPQPEQTYDVVFDVIGKSPFGKCVQALNPKGRYLLANPSLSQALRGRWIAATSDKTFVYGPVSQKPEDMAYIIDLVEAGHLKLVIDKVFPLEQAGDAHHYFETGQKKGNIIIRVAE